ncbi:MAG: histone H1-like repetitive region-containing protein [Ilumatobacter sp.]|nr:histone H1-like repetitive region-containing protein [Ilumatobacter sp.]
MAAPKKSRSAKAAPAKKTAAKKPPAKKSAAKKPAAKKPAAKKSAAKKSAAKKPAAKKPAAKKPAAKKSAAKKPAAKKSAATKPAAKKSPAEKKAAVKTTAPRKSTSKKAAAKKPVAKKAATKRPAQKRAARKPAPSKAVPKRAATTKTTAKKSTAKKSAAKKAATTKQAAAKTKAATATATPAVKQSVPPRRAAKPKPKSVLPSLLSNDVPEKLEVPKPRGTSKDGISYTKDFDVKFLKAQRDELLARRAAELARATRLEDEAISLIEDGEMGDVQFDDEGGEGDTMVVQRDLDRLLSGQARQTIEDIDAALARIEDGTYGYSVVSGRPIPRERLEAIPETTVLAVEKISGAGLR